MKVAIYKKDGTFAAVYEDIYNPRLTDNQLTFDNGNISDFDENHILLEDEVNPPGTLEEAIILDKKADYTFEKVDEIAEIKKQQTDLAFELMLRGVL
jgi:hypothetical protein